VQSWDPEALGFGPTGQCCPEFHFDAVLQPGAQLSLGSGLWQVHAAPGHDPHSVILFAPASRTLVSADALWERGFGVVFPELDGVDAFDEVAATLDLIGALQPEVVIPGHGQPFSDVAGALRVARQRLDDFVASPQRHRRYAAKVLLKFKLLEAQRLTRGDLLVWAGSTDYLQSLLGALAPGVQWPEALDALVQDLERAGAAVRDGDWLCNA